MKNLLNAVVVVIAFTTTTACATGGGKALPASAAVRPPDGQTTPVASVPGTADTPAASVPGPSEKKLRPELRRILGKFRGASGFSDTLVFREEDGELKSEIYNDLGEKLSQSFSVSLLPNGRIRAQRTGKFRYGTTFSEDIYFYLDSKGGSWIGSYSTALGTAGGRYFRVE